MLRALVLIIAALSFFVVAGARGDGWSRGVPLGTWSIEDAIKNFKSFELVVWSGEDERVLYGLCTFTNATAALFAIDGTVSDEGDFYPTVSAQVGERLDGEWKTIRSPVGHGKPATITIEPMSPSKSLHVDLKVFQPFIGKAKYGRLVLRTREAATFELDSLTKPEQ